MIVNDFIEKFVFSLLISKSRRLLSIHSGLSVTSSVVQDSLKRVDRHLRNSQHLRHDVSCFTNDTGIDAFSLQLTILTI